MTKFAFVSAERANHAVATLCRVIGASVSGFYAWLHAIPTVQSRAEAEAELRGQISRIFAARRRVYGSPAYSGDHDRLFQPKVITQSGDHDHLPRVGLGRGGMVPHPLDGLWSRRDRSW